MRDAPQQEESMYKASRDESQLLSDVEKRKDATLDTSLEKPMDLGLDEPLKDDGFGGEMVMGEGILGQSIVLARIWKDGIHICYSLKNRVFKLFNLLYFLMCFTNKTGCPFSKQGVHLANRVSI